MNGTEKSREAALVERRRKQSIGNWMYVVYILASAFLLHLSYLDKLPKFGFDFIPYSDIEVYSKFMSDNHYIPISVCFVYVALIFSIKTFMKSRNSLELNKLLALWSLGLASFSLLGAVRTIPELHFLLQKYGLADFIIGDTRQDWVLKETSSLNTWIFWFVLSKFPELVDTLFIVLKKNKLIFLHWYHHITVLLFCWNTYATMSLYGSIFAVMNFSVHALMYFFYFLAALKYKPKKFAMLITSLQIMQMVVGTAVCSYALFHAIGSGIDIPAYLDYEALRNPSYHHWLPVDSSLRPKNNPGNVAAGLAMYASYFILFLMFFYNTYFASKTPKKKTD